ncbi:UNVERIFIED_CONTAM: hypothetical protein GTU68_008839 [Idotea baltica]|nr:hypothetical protein [Idotea baltica]
MDEQTIVINDLLSFAWCKLKLCSVSKEELRKCLQSFYSPPCATEALETLLLVLPSDINDTRLDKQGPVRAILDLLSRLDASAFGLPVFVCKNLNNVPNFEAFCEELDAGEESPPPQHEVGLYREHETIKSELSELCGSLHELKKQLQVMTSQEGNSTKAKGGARRTPASFHSKQLAKKIKEESMAVSQTKIVPSIPGTNVSSLEDDEYDGEQRTLLIANRYQRALARRVEKGGKAISKFESDSGKFEDSHEVDHIYVFGHEV